MSALITQMHIKQVIEGDFEAALIESDKENSSLALEEYFYIRKVPPDSLCREFEQCLRMTDTDQYLDTFTIDPTVSVEYLMQMMKGLSKG